MARRDKVFVANQIYFITFTILGWLPIFTEDKYIRLVYKWFDYMKEHYGNEVNGYVIMPNHVHLLVRITDRSPSLSVLIMNAKRFLAYQIVKELKKGNFSEELKFFKERARLSDKACHRCFTNRYDSLMIYSRKIFLQKLNYIHNNPCAEHWKLAEKPENYKYSSASNYILGYGKYNILVLEI